MRYGLYLPNFGAEIDPHRLCDLAQLAEKHEWDGFFLWDHILMSKSQKLPMVDPWVALAGMAVVTKNIRLGTTVTPVARRRPWKLARETASLDHLSNGRIILGVGLGEPGEAEYRSFGEADDPGVRAGKLDEGLEILTGLWRGKPFSFSGAYHHLEKMTFLPTPLQQPRIPIWVGGFWPNKPPFRRAAKWDGVIPLKKEGIWLEPSDVVEILDFIRPHRSADSRFDFAVIGNRHTKAKGGITGAGKVAPFIDAGATWWLESLYMQRNSHEDLAAQIRLGPPK
jgi:hypothetical protein